MKIFVGSSSFRGSVSSFRFDLLELGVGPTLPRPKVMERYREQRPELAVSLRLHPDVAQIGVSHPDVARAREAAAAVGARFIVIPTGPRFAPSPSRKQPLAELTEALRSDTTQICWEPRSVFSPREGERWALEAGVILVRDLTQAERPSGPVVYTRLLPLGFGARVTETGLQTLAARLEGAEEAYVVIQGEGALGARQKLKNWLADDAGGDIV